MLAGLHNSPVNYVTQHSFFRPLPKSVLGLTKVRRVGLKGKSRQLSAGCNCMAPFTWSAVGPAAVLAAGSAAAVMMLSRGKRRGAEPPWIQAQATKFNEEVLSRCPTLKAPYNSFALGPHVETILASKLRSAPDVVYDRDILSTSDGGSIAVDYEASAKDLAEDAPVVIMLPGLTGGSHDSYVRCMVDRLRRQNFRPIVFNGRGTGGSPVTSPQFYSSSFTEDMRQVTGTVSEQFPDARLFAIGWSLGGNILMRYLGEEGAGTPISAAVSLCNPFTLPISDANLQVGFNRIYDRNLGTGLSRIYRQHAHLFEGAGGRYDTALAARCTTIRDFDKAITAPCFGWKDVDDYYAGSSSSMSVPHITIPMLCIQAQDDPIAPEPAIPYEALRENPKAILVKTPTGGHLGWMAGPGGAFGEPWTDRPVEEYLLAVDSALKDNGAPVRPTEAPANAPAEAVAELSESMA